MSLIKNITFSQFNVGSKASLGLVLLAFLIIFIKGVPFDFSITGGVYFELVSEEPIDIQNLRRTIANEGYEKVSIYAFGTDKSVQVTMSSMSEVSEGGDQNKLLLLLGLADIKSLSLSNSVEYHPGVQRWKLILFPLVFLLACMCYLVTRLTFRLAIIPLMVVLHDVIIIIAFFSLAGVPDSFELIVALIVLVLFLLNDSLFVLARLKYEFFDPSVRDYNHALIEQILRQSRQRVLKHVLLLCLFFLAYYSISDSKLDYILALFVGSLIRLYSSSTILPSLTRRLFGVINPKKTSVHSVATFWADSPVSSNSISLKGKPMPRQLGDPLYFLYPFCLAMVQFGIAVLCIESIFSYHKYQYYEQAYDQSIVYQAALLFWFLLVFQLSQPKIRSNALYLRSFRKDKESESVREHIEVGLGERFRLSGIRDPRKRIAVWLRPFLSVVMSFQYAGARFLGLEAGDDWLARLWRSFGDSRVLFLDLRDLTDYVKTEILLSVGSVGLDRVLFIVDGSKQESEWRLLLEGILGLEQQSTPRVRIAIWPDKECSKVNFMNQVVQFAQSAPEATGVNFSAFDIVQSSILSKRQVTSERLFRGVGLVAGLCLLTISFIGLELKNLLVGLPFIILMFALMLYIPSLVIIAIKGKLRLLKIARIFNPAFGGHLFRDFISMILTFLLFSTSLVFLVI